MNTTSFIITNNGQNIFLEFEHGIFAFTPDIAEETARALLKHAIKVSGKDVAVVWVTPDDPQDIDQPND